MFHNYICALDIGSTKVAAVVAEIKRGRITNLFFDAGEIKGIKCGRIVNIIEFVNSLSAFLKDLRKKTGVKIKSLYTNISGESIVTRQSSAIILLAERGSKVITLTDIEKVNEQARLLGANLEEEIIHAIPLSYTLDNQRNVLNPLGLYSHRLEVDLYLICSYLSDLEVFIKSINQSGYEVEDIFLSGLATSNVLFDKEFREGLNILCDIGGDITELLVFKDGLLRKIKILSMGGNNLTDQLSQKLDISWDLAEEAKRSYARIGEFSQIDEEKEILIKKVDIYKPIKQRQICEIVTSEAKIIFEKIKIELKDIISLGQINNFWLVGRATLLEGMPETCEDILGIPVKLGKIRFSDLLSLVNKYPQVWGQDYLTYLTALGIFCQAFFPKGLMPKKTGQNIFLRVINKFKEVYQDYF